MRAFYVNIETETAEELTITDKKDCWSLLDAEIFDIVEREIDGRVFTFVCDDKGLLREHPMPSFVTDDGKPILVGNLIIARLNKETGDLMDLTDEEVEFLDDHVLPVVCRGHEYYAICGGSEEDVIK